MSPKQRRTRTYQGLLFSMLTLIIAIGGFDSLASAQVLDTSADRLKKQMAAKKPAQPYQISSRIHLAQGTNQGYLIINVKLNKGYHIYSLTQTGIVPPSKLTVAPSEKFRLTGKFTPDSPAKVNPKDPSLGQRTEKHLGNVQFFAPLELAANVDLAKIAAEVQFDGQVCTEDSCIPVRRHKVQGKFAGYFGDTAHNSDGSNRKPSVAAMPETSDQPLIQQ